jgi:hypothetical protein
VLELGQANGTDLRARSQGGRRALLGFDFPLAVWVQEGGVGRAAAVCSDD